MAPSLSRSFAFAAIFSVALAQQKASTTTLTVPLIGYDGTSFNADVISANKDATVLSLACPSASSDCGLFPYQTLTYGPSTYHMDMSAPFDAFTGTQDCKFSASSAVCAASMGGSEANDPGSATETLTGTDVGSAVITVTAGADKLAATAAAGSKATPTPTGGASSASTPPASAARASASPSPTGNAAGNVVIPGRLLAAAGVLGAMLL